jgi:tripeptide aminopeptidase
VSVFDIIELVKKQILSTFVELTAFDASSKNEKAISSYVIKRLKGLNLEVYVDKKGNVIGFLPGRGEPVLLNAHLDRVLPGKGHLPFIDGGIVKSDGTTNLGSDDSAGITILLETLSEVKRRKANHPPLVVVFTVEEEIGLLGAKALDLRKFRVRKGIVFDNAFEAGTVVSRSAAYVALDIEITGKSTHPGKDFSAGVNVIEIFRKAEFTIGETDNKQTRINIGTLMAGTARNSVPDKLIAQVEIRSFLDENKLTKSVNFFQQKFINAAESLGGTVKIETNKLAEAYIVNPEEKLLKAYKEVIEKRGGKFLLNETFIASDTNVLRGEKGLEVFTVSTGVCNEHTIEETVNLAELEQIILDLLYLLDIL